MDYDNISCFLQDMASASTNEIAVAQGNLVESMGMTLDGGAGSFFTKTGMQDYSAQGWLKLASSVGVRAVPWSDVDSSSIRFSDRDENGDGIPDQQELLLTALIGKKIDANDSISSLKSVGINFTRKINLLPNDNPDLVAEQFASHYSLIRLEEAWDSGINNARGREEVLVAVLDTGIAPLTGPNAHPDWADVDTDASDSVGKLGTALILCLKRISMVMTCSGLIPMLLISVLQRIPRSMVHMLPELLPHQLIMALEWLELGAPSRLCPSSFG